MFSRTLTSHVLVVLYKISCQVKEELLGDASNGSEPRDLTQRDFQFATSGGTRVVLFD